MLIDAERFKPCSVDGCNGNAHWISKGRSGLCHSHYRRSCRHGDPLGGGVSPGEPLRFIEKVALPYDGDDCLIWPFGTNRGYGRIWIDGKDVYASRYVCQRVNGEPPTPEHEAAHECGNRICVNPNHLSWKTGKQNQADRLIHGTHNRGANSAHAKLTEEQAREIIALKGAKSQREIAQWFGVARQTIGKIQAGESWSWLQEDAR